MKVKLSHFIYGPAPKKGYSIRAQSSSIGIGEFSEITNRFFVPINPVIIDSVSYEARMIADTPKSQFIYFSRIFKRRVTLDEKGRRGGTLNHTVMIPKKLLNKNLSYRKVAEAMSKFEEEHGIPMRQMVPN